MRHKDMKQQIHRATIPNYYGAGSEKVRLRSKAIGNCDLHRCAELLAWVGVIKSHNTRYFIPHLRVWKSTDAWKSKVEKAKSQIFRVRKVESSEEGGVG